MQGIKWRKGWSMECFMEYETWNERVSSTNDIEMKIKASRKFMTKQTKLDKEVTKT
jgi:hypothetical protein